MLHSCCSILAEAISMYEISVSTDKSDFMDQIYPPKSISSHKQKKWTSPLKWLQLDSNPQQLSSWTNTQPFSQFG